VEGDRNPELVAVGLGSARIDDGWLVSMMPSLASYYFILDYFI
jgi:hypothetical protein